MITTPPLWGVGILLFVLIPSNGLGQSPGRWREYQFLRTPHSTGGVVSKIPHPPLWNMGPTHHLSTTINGYQRLSTAATAATVSNGSNGFQRLQRLSTTPTAATAGASHNGLREAGRPLWPILCLEHTKEIPIFGTCSSQGRRWVQVKLARRFYGFSLRGRIARPPVTRGLPSPYVSRRFHWPHLLEPFPQDVDGGINVPIMCSTTGRAAPFPDIEPFGSRITYSTF